MNQLEPIFLCSRHLSVMPWSFRPFSSFSSSVSRTWRFFFACQPNVARRTIRAVGLRCLDVQTGARSAQVENLASASPARGGARSAQVVLWGGGQVGSGADVGGKEEEMQNVGVPFLCVCVHFWRSMVEKDLVFFVWSPQTKQNAQMSNHWNNWSSPGSVAHRVRSLSLMFEWSSGHDVCFTRRRSRGQSSPRILLLCAPPFRCCVFLSAWFFFSCFFCVFFEAH